MTKKPIYSPEFREEAARMVVDSSRPIAQVAREIKVNEATLDGWVKSYRQLGDHYAEAETLMRLGEAYEAAAELDAARDAWQQAVAMLHDVHHPDAALILAKLSKLPPR